VNIAKSLSIFFGIEELKKILSTAHLKFIYPKEYNNLDLLIL
jgi:hypothetical protein